MGWDIVSAQVKAKIPDNGNFRRNAKLVGFGLFALCLLTLGILGIECGKRRKTEQRAREAQQIFREEMRLFVNELLLPIKRDVEELKAQSPAEFEPYQWDTAKFYEQTSPKKEDK